MIWGSSDHDLSHSDQNPNPTIIMEQPLSFKCFVEQNLGKSAHFFIYALLEFVMVVLLLVDGLLAFFSYEFAKFFELKIPCFFCTRIDQALVHRNLKNSYYNGTICEAHKRDISSLAYCHAHKKISDIKNMCESCLLSFASDKDSSDYFGEDDSPKLPIKSVNVLAEKGTTLQRCSCCMEFLMKGPGKYSRNASMNAGPLTQAPAPSPRAWRNEELPHLHYTEVKLLPNNETELRDDESVTTRGRDENRALAVPDDMQEDACKTPSTARGNKFFGIPLSDSPRWSKSRSQNMSIDFLSDPSSDLITAMSEGDGGIVQHLKRQVLLERKSRMALCMELDEERNASAIAANEAMAMITRLQAEKAAVQMQASQYQRMMEEQAEYDREEKQLMKDMIMKREDEIEVLEAEIDAYREKYGAINFVCSPFCEIEPNEEFHSLKFQSLSSFGEMSCRSLTEVLDNPVVHPDNEVYLDSDNDRSHHSVTTMETIPETNANEDSSHHSPKHEGVISHEGSHHSLEHEEVISQKDFHHSPKHEEVISSQKDYHPSPKHEEVFSQEDESGT